MKTNKKFLFDLFGWGSILWLIGYILGIVFFMVLPPQTIGWVIMPIGLLIMIWVVIKRIHQPTVLHYFLIGITWCLIAIIFDYFFLVKVFKPIDGYYKLDVYLYYTLTFLTPLIVGWKKNKLS